MLICLLHRSAWRTPPPSGGSTGDSRHNPQTQRANHVPPLDLRDSVNSATFVKNSTASKHKGVAERLDAFSCLSFWYWILS